MSTFTFFLYFLINKCIEKKLLSYVVDLTMYIVLYVFAAINFSVYIIVASVGSVDTFSWKNCALKKNYVVLGNWWLSDGFSQIPVSN